MNTEKQKELMEKVEYLIQHANFYYEQRVESEPFLKQDYPFLQYSARIKREIEELLRGN
jgi:hypothetical protein